MPYILHRMMILEASENEVMRYVVWYCMSLFVLAYASSKNVCHVHIKCTFFILNKRFAKNALKAIFLYCSFRNASGWGKHHMRSVQEVNCSDDIC